VKQQKIAFYIPGNFPKSFSPLAKQFFGIPGYLQHLVLNKRFSY